jgi:serine/threonine protein kinase
MGEHQEEQLALAWWQYLLPLTDCSSVPAPSNPSPVSLPFFLFTKERTCFLMQRTYIAQRYAVLGQLGRGGCGAVYLAQDRQTERYLAIKTPVPPNEYEVLNSLSHPQIPACYGIVEEAGRHFLLMEWIRGETLDASLMRRRPISLLECYHLLSELGAIFQMLAEHDPPISYADLHTDNVLCTPDGRLILIDFGGAAFLPTHRRGKVGAETLRRFLNYYLFPLVERGDAQRLISAWEQDWKLRLWRGSNIFLRDLLASWHDLFTDLIPASQQQKTSSVVTSSHRR